MEAIILFCLCSVRMKRKQTAARRELPGRGKVEARLTDYLIGNYVFPPSPPAAPADVIGQHELPASFRGRQDCSEILS